MLGALINDFVFGIAAFNASFSFKSDVYSFGMLLWQLVTRGRPCAARLVQDIFSKSALTRVRLCRAISLAAEVPWRGFDFEQVHAALLAGKRLALPVRARLNHREARSLSLRDVFLTLLIAAAPARGK